MKQLFTEKDLEEAISDGIFNERNEVTSNPSQVIRWFEEWARCKFGLYQPGINLVVGTKVGYVNNPNRTGIILQKTNNGRCDKYIVKWNLTGIAKEEYGSSLFSLTLEPKLNQDQDD